MTEFLLWYLTISLVGLLALPLAFWLLPGLDERGYTLARTLGLLIWAYVFWLLATLGILHNNTPGLLLALLIVLALGLGGLRASAPARLLSWLKKRWRFVLLSELLFLLAFGGMALVRAANPDILGTEKPMELAFINAILNSPTFPPHDPWLSGYAISYYYFGYVMTAMLAAFTSTPGPIAFNLAIALVFGLSALGAFGVVHDLLAKRFKSNGLGSSELRVTIKSGVQPLALLGPVFILLVGNLGGLLEVLHASGVGWSRAADSSLVSPAWKWLDMRELSNPPSEPFSWQPTRYLWWWRASRVIQDYDYGGNWKEIIDEFPAFSYILADLHPHVLAMPFAFLAMALAFNLLNGGAQGKLALLRQGQAKQRIAWLARWFNEPLHISPAAFILAGVALGGMAFLNIWDFPFYVFVFAAAYAASRGIGLPFHLGRFSRDLLYMAIMVGLAGLLFYLPYYIGFSSQAGGVLPNLVYPSRGAHLWVMFATLWVPVLIYFWKLGQGGGSGVARLDLGALRPAFLAALGLLVGLWLLSLAFGALISLIPERSAQFLGSLAAPNFSLLLGEALRRRLASFSGWLTLLVLLTLALSLLAVVWRSKFAGFQSDLFSLILFAVAVLLVMGPEFFYLLDLFGWRMNTIFKFYYQAWLMFGVVAAYGTAVLVGETLGIGNIRNGELGVRGALGLISIVLVIAAGLVYTVFGVWERASGFHPAFGWSLDGVQYLERARPDEVAGARWLADAPPGVVAEAVGGSYSEYGFISMLSGQPTVLGWDFHEYQWRGDSQEGSIRQADIQRLYCTGDEEQAREIMARYDIRYVFIGPLERRTYKLEPEICPRGLNEIKFKRWMAPVFQQGEVVIYAAQ
jgi:YYY domain-containing protein